MTRPDPWLAEYEVEEARHWRAGRWQQQSAAPRYPTELGAVMALPTRAERRAYLERFRAEHGDQAAEELQRAVVAAWPLRRQ